MGPYRSQFRALFSMHSIVIHVTADYTLIMSRTLKVMVIMSCMTAAH